MALSSRKQLSKYLDVWGHDWQNDMIVQDFTEVIVSDRRSHYGKMIMSDRRRSQKM